jgi:hypothetical protein
VKRWPEIRAGLILLAICVGLIDGCPLPPRDKTPEWERGFVEPIRTLQHVALTPFAWVRPTLRIAQRWSLYQAPTSDGFRLWIEGQDTSGRWQLLFRSGDDEHQDDAALIDGSRTRGAWNAGTEPPEQYPLFARWMTSRVLEQHPDFIAARVRFETVHTGPSGMQPSGLFVFPHVRQRGAP